MFINYLQLLNIYSFINISSKIYFEYLAYILIGFVLNSFIFICWSITFPLKGIKLKKGVDIMEICGKIVNFYLLLGSMLYSFSCVQSNFLFFYFKHILLLLCIPYILAYNAHFIFHKIDQNLCVHVIC